MEKIFKLKENGTTVRTEIVAGLTTFMTMAYIIALNPNLIVGFGQGAFGAFGDDATAAWNGVFMATCLASAVAMICMAFLANKPFALAPGMGLNSYFAIVIAQIAGAAGCSMLVGLQAGLCIILIEGIVFVLLSVFNIRQKIVEAIPLGVRLGIGLASSRGKQHIHESGSAPTPAWAPTAASMSCATSSALCPQATPRSRWARAGRLWSSRS